MDNRTQSTETGYPGSETNEQDHGEILTRAAPEPGGEMPDSSTNQTKWRSFEFWFVAGSLLFIPYNYVMDIKTIIDYFRQGETVLLCFYLFWTALPTISIHLFIFIRIRSNCSQFLSFLISPWLLSFKYLQVYGQSTPTKAVIERTRTVVTVVQCLFKAIPQLCIQSAAWWTGYQADSPIFFEGTTETTMHMLYKIHSVAFSLLADFSNDMPFYWRFVNWIPVALVFGARVFVLTSLFSLQDSWRWTCFIPPFLGFFASWLLSVRTDQRRVAEACAKTLLLPPSDVAGIVPSALYVVVYGAAVLAGKDSTFVELLIVLFIHSVSGCLWEYILDKKYKVD